LSASLNPAVASVTSTTETAIGLLASLTALSGQLTDINPGSQVRTLAEVIGAVVEEQGIASQALAFQALAYGAMSLFDVQQTQAMSATGIVTFATSLPLSAAFIAPQSITIPSGTLVQTAGGVQFATIAATTIASGTATNTVGVIATTSGSAGNVPSGSITGTPLTPVGYPIYATNTVATAGGADAGTQSQALALFTSRAAALGLSSPVAIANAVIGVVATGTGEVVNYASVFEPWISAGSGVGSGTAGFTLYIDNGTGTASASLLAAAQAFITGNVALGQSGYRPAGVPFNVAAVTPVFCSVGVTGTLLPGLVSADNVTTTVTSGVQSYFTTVGIAPAAAYQPRIAGAVADAAAGAFSSLAVTLSYSGSATPQALVSGAIGTRIILSSLNVNISVLI
jgi:uncharacterized phage protein gp47/JayE